jgi:mannose-1-phosphate guanylyltransferase
VNVKQSYHNNPDAENESVNENKELGNNMSEIQVILFSGGRGTRLYPITSFYQKVMMPLGTTGRPMLEYIIRHLTSYGITRYIALVGYRANQIRRYFGNGSRFGVEFEYVLDSPTYKGTGGALLNAEKYISTETMLIYFTDILSNIDISKLLDFHYSKKNLGTAWIDPSWKVPEGVIHTADKTMVTSIEYNPQHILANTGISILETDVFEVMKEIYLPNQPLDLSRDVFTELVKRKLMNAYLSDNWWVDIGSLSRHQQITDQMLDERFDLDFS